MDKTKTKECKWCEWIGDREVEECPECGSDEFFEGIYE
jgi:RNA polymerase subunit RPABC4/transcription elongation factor Spt4